MSMITAALPILLAAPALAQANPSRGRGPATQVPEIDASVGLAALAAVLAATLLVWEIRRRRRMAALRPGA